jgi:hypothetical protein
VGRAVRLNPGSGNEPVEGLIKWSGGAFGSKRGLPKKRLEDWIHLSGLPCVLT